MTWMPNQHYVLIAITEGHLIRKCPQSYLLLYTGVCSIKGHCGLKGQKMALLEKLGTEITKFSVKNNQL